MTVTDSGNFISYAGDGATTSFSVPFEFTANSWIQAVLVTDSDGSVTTWTEGTEYSLTGAGEDSGGTLTVSTSPTDYTPASGTTLIITRIPPLTQASSLPLAGRLPSTTLEGDDDKLTMIAQRLQELINRCIRIGDDDVVGSLNELGPKADRASAFLRFDSNGEQLTLVTSVLSDTVSPSALGTSIVEATTASAILTLLGVSAFIQTLLDDADAATARATLGISDALTTDQYTLVVGPQVWS